MLMMKMTRMMILMLMLMMTLMMIIIMQKKTIDMQIDTLILNTPLQAGSVMCTASLFRDKIFDLEIVNFNWIMTNVYITR